MIELKVAERGRAIAANPDAALVGESAAIWGIRSAVELIASKDIPVIITGEAGTGKEAVARYIHSRSPHAKAPFVTVQNDEDFGVSAGGSTFFKEISALSHDTQAKIVAAIEENAAQKAMRRKKNGAGFHIIAATSRRIDDLLKEGLLKEDLHQRLNGFEITLPPLKERVEDIPLLVEHFLARFRAEYGTPSLLFSAQALDRLIAREWPGNIRELRSVIEDAILLSPSDVLELQG